MKVLTHRGLGWEYESSGQGEVVVFIHGFGGSGIWWQYQQEFLEKDFRVITFDLPGHGKTDWAPLSLTEMAVDIRQILNGLGVYQFSVVASSFGGLVAIELYRLAAEQVMRMSFVGALFKFARGADYPAGLDIDKIRKLSAQFDGDYAVILDIFFRSLFTMKERDSQAFKDLKKIRQQDVLPRREALKAFLEILEKTDVRDRLSSLICPTQYITGSDDYICPPGVMAWMSQHAVNARFDVIKGCGHLPFLTEIKEYNRLLEDFLLS